MRRAVIALILVFVALPASAAASTRAVDFEQAIPGESLDVPGVARAAGGPLLTSAPLRAPRRFDLLGVRWRGGVGRVWLRVREGDGSWSRWIEAPPSEQAPARPTGATHAAGPVWTGGATRYQLRIAGRVRDARVHFVAVARTGAAPVARPAAGGRPAIVPRSVWDPGNDCPPRVTPIYGRVDFAMVHHTLSLNSYGPADAPAIVLAICRFHRNGNGWNDIGYNLLADRYGRLYEGRGGGLEAPVVGAQAQGWNSVSTGVAAIGDFSGSAPPAAMLHAIARAIAWKLGLAGVPASGPPVGEVSIGGDLNRWREGAHVRFQRISGHRDGDGTECPGGALYARLPQLRAEVQRLLPAPRDHLTISPAVAPQPQGGPVFLTGRLARADGRRPAGAAVVLQQRADGVWSDLASVTTSVDGIWSAALPLTQNTAVRAVAVASGIASAEIPILVEAAVSVRVSSRHVRAGGTIELTGTTTPAKPRVRVLAEQQLQEIRGASGDRVREHIQITRSLATIDGRWATSLRFPKAGIYRVTIHTPADGVNAAGSSRSVSVRVLRGR